MAVDSSSYQSWAVSNETITGAVGICTETAAILWVGQKNGKQ